MNKKAKPASAETPDLEKSLGELEKIVARLETGELTLDESLKQFERGVELTRQCQAALANAEQKVEVLLRKSGDQYVAEDFAEERHRDSMTALSFAQRLSQWQARAETQLDRRLPAADSSPQRLHEAMRYAVLGNGKRVRPVLVYATGETLGLPLESLDGAACAVEFIHAYSLVHDDLPAMDDDDLRRGRPTCHKAFDEATAILAGDALQVLAFEVLAADPTLPTDPAIRLRLIQILAQCSGTQGMAGGQALDLGAAGRTLTMPEIVRMHEWKTGALIRAAVTMAAACSPARSVTHSSSLTRFADAIGLAFQIQDDLLDIEGDPTLLGKAVGADQALGKPTYPAIAGLESSRQRVQELHAQALAELSGLNFPAHPLRDVSDWLVLRRQ